MPNAAIWFELWFKRNDARLDGGNAANALCGFINSKRQTKICGQCQGSGAFSYQASLFQSLKPGQLNALEALSFRF